MNLLSIPLQRTQFPRVQQVSEVQLSPFWPDAKPEIQKYGRPRLLLLTEVRESRTESIHATDVCVRLLFFRPVSPFEGAGSVSESNTITLY